MTLADIEIGTLLEIYIKRNGYNYKVVSKIEYVDDTCIGVSPIASRTKLFRFKSTDVVDIIYRLDDKSWKWEKVKAGIGTLDDGTKLHIFEPRVNAVVYNRRSTYRLPMNIEISMTYEVLDESVGKMGASRKTPELVLDATLDEISKRYIKLECPAFLKDLSEGGAAVSADAELEKGTVVSFRLRDGESTIVLRALVVRIRQDKGEFYKYHYGLSFIETSSNYVSFFFREQRKRLSDKKKDFF